MDISSLRPRAGGCHAKIPGEAGIDPGASSDETGLPAKNAPHGAFERFDKYLTALKNKVTKKEVS